MSVLPTNVAGMLLILFGLVLFLLEIKVTSYGLLTVGALVSLFVGSMILFRMEGGMSGLPLSTVIVTVVGVGLLVAWAVYLVGKAQRTRPATGVEGLVGMTGQVRQWQGQEGTIFVHGEQWSARSETATDFQTGDQVVVTGLQGLKCIVSRKEA
jgi:membrane-bound serine protease (ClpP class)